MRIAEVKYKATSWLGVVNISAETIQLVTNAQDKIDPAIAFIEASLANETVGASGEVVEFKDVQFLPPIQRPSKNVICGGKNYSEHAAELTGSGYDSSARDANDIIPDVPNMFSKAPCSMTGAFDEIIVPWGLTKELDYEAELGLVIGLGGPSIPERDAHDHVWGYTGERGGLAILNDPPNKFEWRNP